MTIQPQNNYTNLQKNYNLHSLDMHEEMKENKEILLL
jgi:hypothetical protein